MRANPLIALLLASASWAQPALKAPETLGVRSRVPAISQTEQQVQGGLVDLRYGQVCVDLGGEAVVLELPKDAQVFLDGSPLSPEEILKLIPQGLGVVATYHATSGTVATLEAFSRGAKLPGVQLTLLPLKGPAYRSGDLVTVLLSTEEANRLGGKPLTLLVPGLKTTAFVPAQRGGWKASLRAVSSTNLVDVPLLVRSGDKIFTGPTIGVATSGPALKSFGPHAANTELSTIPGWIDLRHPPKFLDLSSAKLRVSEGARVVKFQPRVDRTVFELEVDGPGDYRIDFEVSDVLGNTSRQSWPLIVRP